MTFETIVILGFVISGVINAIQFHQLNRLSNDDQTLYRSLRNAKDAIQKIARFVNYEERTEMQQLMYEVYGDDFFNKYGKSQEK